MARMLYCGTYLWNNLQNINTGVHKSNYWFSLVCKYSSQLAPVNLPQIGQTSNVCTKRINAQMGCVTNVDFYSLYAFTYVAGVRYISKLVCYHQVLFAAVTKLQQFKKTTNMFAASGFHNIPRIIFCACAHTTRYVTGKLPVYNVCSLFKHYVGLVNLPHSSTCSMFP